MLTKSIDEYPMLYDVGLRVLLIIRAPGGEAGSVIEDAVELIDLCPTLLACAGVDIAPEIQGRSPSKALTGGDLPERKYVFAESGAVKMIRGVRHKLVHYPGQAYGELYDLYDPQEMDNLYSDPRYEEIREGLTRDLADLLIHMEAPPR